MQNAKFYTEYNKVTGAIMSVVESPYKPIIFTQENALLKKESNPEIHRVDLESLTIVERLTFTESDTNVNGVFTMPVPIDTEIIWDDEFYKVEDELLEIEIDQPDSYILKLSHPCYFDKEITIENS